MKTGDSIRLTVMRQDRRKIELVTKLRVDGGEVFTDIAHKGALGELAEPCEVDLAEALIEPDDTGRAAYRYTGETGGGIVVPDMMWS